jgi:hypothetical protein
VGKTLGGFLGGGVNLYEAIDLRHFQDSTDHARDAGEAQGAAGDSQAREAIYNFSDTSAVDLRNIRKIQHDAGPFLSQKIIDSQLQPFALHTHLKRAVEFENHNAGFKIFPGDFHASSIFRGAGRAMKCK